MGVNNIKRLSELASTALATYSYFSNLDDLYNRLVLPDNKQGVGMTEVQRDAFVARYALLDQHANDFTGFSATLFNDKIDTKKVLALRGTEFTHGFGQAITDGAIADGLGIGLAGFANEQAVQLYRFVKQLTTASVGRSRLHCAAPSNQLA